MSTALILKDYPEILKRIFENIEVNPAGVYGVWLCVNAWKCYVIDDKLPIDGDKPYFSSAGSSLNIPLLEKAFAKALKNYSRI